MSQIFPELPGFSAEIDEVVFTPELESPPDAPYGFAYRICIRNESDRSLTVRHRKWIIRTLGSPHIEIIEGDGVVGQTPVLNLGDDFTYHSRHFVRSDAVAEGSYFAQDDSGTVYACKLPPMALKVPEWSKGKGF
jgi:ApaG protein